LSVGDRYPGVVLRPFQIALRHSSQSVSSPMIFLISLAGFSSVLLSGFLFAAFGRFLLDRARLTIENRAERLLASTALGVAALDILVSLGELAPNVRAGVTSAMAFAAALGLFAISAVFRDTRAIIRKIATLRGLERWLALSLGVILFLEGFAAMAPLTGSDALHYHFPVPWLILQEGFHANWFLSHSFFTGLSHQLILAGLSAGSEKLALGWIYLGGAVASLAGMHLARQWVTGIWPWLTALAFLLIPVTFWQITTAGAPDIWMACFVTLGVLFIVRAKQSAQVSATVFAGVMAGAVAGTKYTGLLIAACLFLAFIWEMRRFHYSVIYLASATITGIGSYLRNWVWSGDPLFPFLMRHLEPSRVNAYALAGYLADTGASTPRSLSQIIEFPLLAETGLARLDFSELLGPLVLCFAPLTVLAVRKTPIWRAVLIVWLGAAVGIGLTSGMIRFVLPLLPIALAASMVGVAQLDLSSWRVARFIAKLSIVGFLLFGLGGLALYDRNSWAVSVGLIPRDKYLREHAPDYARAEFVNNYLSGKESEGRALVFFRHLYYLRVPYAYGHPEASWAVNPDELLTDDSWRLFLRTEHIRWVVRAPDYPQPLSTALKRLESENILVPCATGEVEDFLGNRIGGARKVEPITILSVQN
jgi:hypothetical protein